MLDYKLFYLYLDLSKNKYQQRKNDGQSNLTSRETYLGHKMNLTTKNIRFKYKFNTLIKRRAQRKKVVRK